MLNNMIFYCHICNYSRLYYVNYFVPSFLLQIKLVAYAY